MYYTVVARYIPEKLGELYQKLLDGSIRNQKPDGPEIYDSMLRAREIKRGVVQWSERCYCEVPLQHERKTVLDKYFFIIDIRPVDGYEAVEGKPFTQVMREAKKPQHKKKDSKF